MEINKVLLILAFISIKSIEGKNVLLVPFNSPSHLLKVAGCGHGIVKMGHEVHMVVHSGQMVPPSITAAGIKIITYTTDDKVFPWETQQYQLTMVNVSRTGSMFNMVKGLLNNLAPEVMKMVLNEELISELQKKKFDFVVIDGNSLTRGIYVIPHRLGLPFASITAYMPFSPMSATLQIPYLLPAPILPFSKTSTFCNRFIIHIAAQMLDFAASMLYDENKLRQSCEEPFESLKALMGKSTLWLVDLSDIVDVPKPTLPNTFMIGGLSVSPPKPLPAEIQAYADEARVGLIVMTFGGTLGYLPQDYVDRIILGVGKVKYKVIWRQKTKPGVKIPSNLKIVDWMPQNDLLGHPNTKLFITHCGSGGQHESIYHGVPMLGLPVGGDQKYNAQKFTAKGFGKYLDIKTFTKQEFADTINEVISNPKFRNSIQKASRIFKSQKMLPREKAAYWVDHVMEHGADHLISYTNQLAWYEILMLDIIAAYIAIAASLTYVFIKMVKMVYRKCIKKQKRKEE